MLKGAAPFKEIDWTYDDSSEPDVYDDADYRKVHMQKLLDGIEDEGEEEGVGRGGWRRRRRRRRRERENRLYWFVLFLHHYSPRPDTKNKPPFPPPSL